MTLVHVANPDAQNQTPVSAAAPMPVAIYAGGAPIDTSTPVPTVDASGAAFSGVVAMTVGTAYTAQRSIGINCTVPGNVSLTLSDASTIVVPVSVGWNQFPFATTEVNTSGTTATATYYNLK